MSKKNAGTINKLATIAQLPNVAVYGLQSLFSTSYIEGSGTGSVQSVV